MHSTFRGAATPRTLVRRALTGVSIFGLAALLGGCGVGGTEDLGSGSGAGVVPTGNPSQALTITTVSLPHGQPGVPYPSISLTAANAAGAARWNVTEGSLPAGLVLSLTGVLSGVPQNAGVHSFTATVSASGASASRTLALSVGALGLVATDGLLAGVAFADLPVTLTCVGASGNVRFEVVATQSGGAFAESDPTRGTATWRPGPLGDGAVDTLRVVDLATGASAQIAFTVASDPTAGFRAEFGTSDVWYVDTTRKTGSHAYASDLHDVLVASGLRMATSTSREGTATDRVAETCVRIAMLKHLNTFFLRNPNGSRGLGLPISFPYAEPVGYERPVEGSWLSGGAQRFSVVSVLHGSTPGVLGTAFNDSQGNSRHENDTTAPGAGELGVFANRFVGVVNLAYNCGALVYDPIDADDLAALTNLLHGRPETSQRGATLRNSIGALGRSLAAVAAHEIGHSLGLAHTNPSAPGSIMNSTCIFAPDVQHVFTEAALAQLRGALPGAGRGVGAGKLAATGMPEGGLEVCGQRCDLHLAGCGCACEHTGTR